MSISWKPPYLWSNLCFKLPPLHGHRRRHWRSTGRRTWQHQQGCHPNLAGWFSKLHVCIYIYMYTYVCKYIDICKYVYINIYMYVYIYIYVYVYEAAFIYICYLRILHDNSIQTTNVCFSFLETLHKS